MRPSGHQNLFAQRGFMLAPLLYMLALAGIGAAVMFSGYSQILRSNAEMTAINAARSQLQSAGQTLSASSVLDAATSSIVQPPSVYSAATVASSADATRLPTNYGNAANTGSPHDVGVIDVSSGVRQLDPWGKYYMYCRWENPVSTPSAPSLMVISAGPDGILNTKCGDTTAQGDDRIITSTVAETINRANVWQVSSSSQVKFGLDSSAVRVNQDGSLLASSLTVTEPAAGNATPLIVKNKSGTTVFTVSNTGTASAGSYSANTGAFTTLSVSGVAGLGSANVTGATTIGSTLGVTGATTLTGALAANGGVSTSTLSTSGAATLASAAVTGAATVGSTLGVTGNTTLGGTLGVTGLATLNSLSAGPSGLGNTQVTGTLGSSGNFNVATNKFTVDSSTGNIVAAGSVTGGAASLGATTLGSNHVTGNETVDGTFTSGNVNITGGHISGVDMTGSTGGTAGSVAAGNVTGCCVAITAGGTGGGDAATARANLGANNASNLTTGTVSVGLLPTSGVTAGSYNYVTVDAYGRVTAASNQTASQWSNSGSDIYFTGGNVGIGTNAASQKLDVNGDVMIRGAAGSSRNLFYGTGTSKRWSLNANSTSEGGSNAGSDFTIASYKDDGTALATVFQITRSNSAATFAGTVTANGGFVGNLTGNVTGNVNGSISGAISLSDGTVSAPGLYFTADTNTGLYRPGSDIMGITAGGTDVARFVGNTSSVNYFNIASAVTGNPVSISAAGMDTDISIALTPKGAGTVNVGSTKLLVGGMQAIYNANGTYTGSLFYGNGGGSLSNSSGTQGYYNTGAGIGALYSVTTGANSTAFGYSTLYSNTTGGNNTAIGKNALYSNTTGSTNTALGMNTLYTNTAGTSNIAAGQGALYSNTTGSYNNALGVQSLYYNTTGASNVANGYQALYSNTTGSFNVADGYQALYSNTTGSTNTAVGYAALNLNTTGTSNIAVGDLALQNNTTGGGNTATGHTALQANTTGTYNAAYGYAALGQNTTGGGNTAMGLQALLANTTASNNTAMGYQALASNTTGTNNSAFGAPALSNNTTGQSNVAFGNASLQANTTGNYSVALGSASLQANTTASYNAGVGYFALSGITTGANNIGMGFSAGSYIAGGGNNQTSANSVYLGNNTSANADGDTNEIVIGYNAAGLGSNSVVLGNSSIATTALRGSVGIGTTAPAATALLDITSTSKGFLPPRMTTIQRNAISSPATGLTVYNTDTNLLNIYNGSAWSIAGNDGSSTFSFPAGSVGAPGLYVTGNATTGFYQPSTNKLSVTAGGVEVERWNTLASAVDYLSITPGAAGTPGAVTVGVGGSDTDINIALTPKGLGKVAASNAVSITGGTVTATTPIIDGTQTWNASGTTFTGIKENVTDTASAAASLLMDLQVGGTSKFNVSKGGTGNFAGFLTAANLSGTNTGDQTITLTGDVTGSGTGTFAATIGAGRVTMAKLSATGTADATTFLRGDGTWQSTSSIQPSGFNPGTVTAPGWAVIGNTSTGLYQATANTVSFTAGGVEVLRGLTTASGVDYFTMAPGATGTPGVVTLGAAGSDTDVSIALTAKGAGTVNVSGTKLLVNGVQALYSPTNTLNSSTFYGNGGSSLSHTTGVTGYFNTGVGTYALNVLTTGRGNSALGYNSLANTTTGINNTATGYGVLTNNTTGFNNTGSGYGALGQNTTGTYNVALGVSALNTITTGNYNVGLGYAAGGYIADGSTSNATSNNSVYLGDSTKALADGDANEIVIGSAATGLGSNTVILGNSSITKTQLQGSVGIGTATPAATALLDITSTAKGFLPPRMTGAQRDAISSPATGLQIYNTTTNAMNVYNGTAWGAVGGGALAQLSDVALSSPGSGQFLQYNGTNWINSSVGAVTATAGPSFRAYKNASANVTSGTWTKIVFDTKDYDTNNNFNVSTGRFTATLPGKYLIHFEMLGRLCGAGASIIAIYKNGAQTTYSAAGYNSGSNPAMQTTAILDFNGTTDYVEGYLWENNPCNDGTDYYGGSNYNSFQGALIAPTVAATNFAAGTAASPGLWVTGNTNTGLFSPATNTLSLTAGGVEVVRGNTIASAVNYLNLSPSATGGALTIGAAGTDTNISLNLTPKGTGAVGIGSATPAASALLDMSSTSKGFLPPRMTGAQRDAISSPATGLQIYNTTTNAMNVYNGTAWGAVGGGGSIGTDSDVTLTSVANNDILRYDSTSSKWKNVNIGTAMNTTTMVASWPDAILCMTTAGHNVIYYLDFAMTSDSHYEYDAPYNSSTAHFIEFNPDGTYYTSGGYTPTNCNSTISAVAAAGRSYNFLGNSGATTFNVGTVSAPGLAVTTNTTTGLYQATSNTLSAVAGGVEVERWNTASSAVNYLNVTPSATGAAITVGPAGSDTNISLNLLPKGTGSIGIGSASPAASALLDMNSTTQGLLPPRMTTAQRNAISSPATGLQIYNTTTNQMNVYNGTAWGAVGGGALSGLSDVALSSPGSGQFLQYNGSSWINSNVGAVTASQGPSFSAYLNSNQSISTNTWTKVSIATVTFDTNNNFSTSNNRFQPTIPGKYVIVASTYSAGAAWSGIYKNGTLVSQGYGSSGGNAITTTVVDMNGTSDYVEMWIYGSSPVYAGSATTYFSGALIAPTVAATNFAAGTAASPGLWITGNTNTGLFAPATNTLSMTAGGVEAIRANTAASAVNYLNVTPSATGSAITIGPAGTDTNISMNLAPKGTGAVGIGSATPAASALLDMSSTSKGFLPPRMTTAQKSAISSPATGLTVYDSTLNQLAVYNGTAWGAVGGGGSIGTDSDVTLTSVANNDILRYDSTSSKWKNVNIGTAMNTTTMVANWPDAIRCTVTTPNIGSIIFLLGQSPDQSGNYMYVYNQGSRYQITYASNGTMSDSSYYNGSWNTMVMSDCGSATMAANYSAGRAFNFIGTGAVTTFNVGTAAAPGFAVTSNTNTGFYQASSNTLSAVAGGVEVERWNTATSAVNYLNVTPSATGAAITVGPAGSDTNISLNLLPKGTGSIGIGSASPAASALVDMNSTTQGLLPPRMTTTQRNAISSPATGLEIYNTSTNMPNYYNGSAWTVVGSGASSTFAAGTVSAPGWAVTTDTASGLYQPASSTLSITAGGVEVLRGLTTASGVDYFTMAPGAAGTPGVVTLGAAGSDTNVSIALTPKGAGTVNVSSSKLLVGGTQAVYNANGTYTGSIFYGDGGGSLSNSSGTQGYYNTGAGIGALYSATTGAQNTAFGNSALYSNTTGGNQTAIGRNALYSNTTGNSNLALGVSALYTNTSGGVNIAIGNSALYSNTTAAYNIAMGVQALYSNTTGTPNIAIGYRALYASTTGGNNVATGYQALYTNTTGTDNVAMGTATLYSNTTGVYNIALGSSALYYNTTGGQNIAIGTQALFNNTTGGANTAAGYSALQANTTGTYNAAFGSTSLAQNTTGGNNTAIGFQALLANTTASNNTAMGYQALVSNTTGTNNSAFGAPALSNNTTGQSNVAFGNTALQANTTGGNNVALGVSALQGNTTASYNVGVGANALGVLTTGANNIGMGFSAGAYINGGGNNQTSSNSIYLGYNSSVAADGDTNEIVIGYNAAGLGSNSVVLGNSSITKTQLQGSVGIGTATPAATALLDITSTAKGFLPPRMTGAQRDAISSPATGLQIYNTTTNAMNVYNGTAWGGLGGGGSIGTDSDVTLTSVTNNDVLRYDSTSSKWKNVNISTAMNTTTMVSNWPDAINCNYSGSTANGNVMLYAYAYDASGSSMVYQSPYNSVYYQLSFTTGGAYSSNQNLGSGNFNCINKSITQLYASGQAYNFLGTGAVTTFNVGTVTAPGLAVTSNTSTGFYQAASNTLSMVAGGVEVMRGNTVASAVNYFNLSPSATGNAITLAAAGSDTNVGIALTPKGAGTVNVISTKLLIGGAQAIYNASTAFTGTSFYGTGGGSLSHTTALEGYYNTGVGVSALNSNTTGYSNTATGVNALLLNTTGYSNTAVGMQALSSNTSGVQNTANGVNALYTNSTGYSNTANGFGALFLNTTGYSNAAMGIQALYSNTTGSSNSALGYYAGQYIADNSTANATSSNSVYLGASTKALADGDANEIVIGYNSTGLGSNSVVIGNGSITKTQLQGNVGIPASAYLNFGSTFGTSGYGIRDNGGTIECKNSGGAWAACAGGGGSSTFAAGTVTAPGWAVTGNTSTGLYQAASGTLSVTAGGVEVERWNNVASAVNYFSLSPSATGNGITLAAAGSDTNIGINLTPKGTGTLNVSGNTMSFGGTQTINVANSSLYLGVGSISATGSSNIALGNSALRSTTGTSNIAIGGSALYSNSSGTSNIAIGGSALYSNSGSNYSNLAVGNNALYYNTGSYNVAVGDNALGYNSTSSYNVAVGYQAGYYSASPPNQTSSYSVYLGTSTKSAASGDTNEIVIGYNAVGLGSNSVVLGNSSITKTQLQGSVGIGTNNPGYPLDVNGVTNLRSSVYMSGTPNWAAGYYLCLYSNQVNWGSSCSGSDIRLKRDIHPLESSLDKIVKLRGVSYFWKDTKRGTSKNIGLIAQEVEKVFPEVVNTEPSGMKSMQYDKLTAPLIDAVKELKALFDSLTAKIDALVKQVALHDSDIMQLKHENQMLKAAVCKLDATAAFCAAAK